MKQRKRRMQKYESVDFENIVTHSSAQLKALKTQESSAQADDEPRIFALHKYKSSL